MSTRRQRLMLIEQDPVLREVTAFRLELLGYDVESLDNPEQALTRLQEVLPEVVICGAELPGLDGVELIDRLSNEVRTADIPVMLLSPHSDLTDVQRAFNAGADDYLVTPYDPLVLENKIERLAQTAVAVAEDR